MPTLTDGDGFTWDFNNSASYGTSGASIGNGTGDAFDDGLTLNVNGTYVTGTFGPDELSGRQMVLNDSIAGLDIVRRVYVPDTSGEGWARFLESFTNNTGSQIVATITVASNSGNDGGMTINATSSGDTTFTTADNWIINDDYSGGGDPTVFHLFGDGTRSPDSVSNVVFNAAGNQGVAFTYVLTIDPGQTVSILHFASQQNDLSSSQAELATIDGLGGDALTGLTGGQIASVVNWNATTPPNSAPVNGVPGAQVTAEDTALVFSAANANAITVSDSDAGGGALRVTLTAAHGKLTLAGTAGLTFGAGDGTADASMTFDGTLASINAALNGLSFTPDLDYNGAASVTVTTNDLGHTGTGGALQDSDVVNVNVTPVDDLGIARNDRFFVSESGVLNGNVFASNGFGPDVDVDNPLVVGSVVGVAGFVGQTITVGSGSSLRINADGTLTYTPGGEATMLAAAGSGASNTQLSDNFDYSLVGGGTGNVTVIVNGTDGADILRGTSGNDNMHAGNFNDVLMGDPGADTLDGGPGTDTVSYAESSASVFVNLTLGEGHGNWAEGDHYSLIENVIGSSGNDFLIGDPGVNRLDGGPGNDTIIGAVGPDVLIGGSGVDLLSYEDNSGTVFVNLLTGMGYNNAAQGDTYSGFENVIGGLFDDTLIGDNGANRLDGAMGADTLVGNGGADTFVFSYAPGATSDWGSPNADTIFDFVSGSDKLEISATAFGGGLTPGALAADQFVIGTAAGDANDRFIYDEANGNLYFDADGSGSGAKVLMAVFPNHDAIAATDFVIV